MTIPQINQLLLSWGIPSFSTRCQIYQLKRKWWPSIGQNRLLLERQIDILNAIRLLPWEIFLVSAENPNEWELDGPWIEAAENTWIIPAKQSTDTLFNGYLASGRWVLYLAPQALPNDAILNLLSAPVEDVCGFLQSNSIPAMVQALQENSKWRIALEPAVVPMVAVA